jgi:hypothetical protein
MSKICRTFAADLKNTYRNMTTMTLQVPGAQVGWFVQMVRSMGWSYQEEKTTIADKRQAITPAMRRAINKARQESENGEVTVCRTPQEMQQYFDAL